MQVQIDEAVPLCDGRRRGRGLGRQAKIQDKTFTMVEYSVCGNDDKSMQRRMASLMAGHTREFESQR